LSLQEASEITVEDREAERGLLKEGTPILEKGKNAA
jgi:hypothetical protein